MAEPRRVRVLTPERAAEMIAAAVVASGDIAVVHSQIEPAAVWSITHGLGRLPAVTLYNVDGTPFRADYFATASLVTVQLPAARPGFAILN